MLTAESALVLFLMLAISSISLFVAQKIRVPHTVLLVAIGVFLAFLTTFPAFSFLGEFSLTPELLFFIFLPTLIFESAYNINIKHLTHDSLIISILAVISLVISAFGIAIGLNFAFDLIGLTIPFILSLVFGAIISATDPVAVLALFKEYGAPRRLSLIFEGESIFNDGTGVALFLIVLAIAESGTYTSTDILHGSITFSIMVVGGIIFGLVFGGFFAKLIGYTRSNEFASITLTVVLAHLTFICAELFSHHITIYGEPVLISSIIATATASLLMGNYGRYKLPAHALEFVEKYWSQFAFLANSLIFILIGMLAIELPAATPELIIPVLITIVVVAVARAVSIYPVLSVFNFFVKREKQIPKKWQHVLAWGSLRGALAVTMVLMIPDTLMFEGWSYTFTPKELVLTLTVGCVFATLFVKATTIGLLMEKLRLNTFTPLEEVNYREMLIYIYDTTIKRIAEAHEKGYLNKETFDCTVRKQQSRLQKITGELKNITTDPLILEKVIRLHAIGIERKYIRELYAVTEVSEIVIKRIMAKLEYQSNAIEHNILDEQAYTNKVSFDVFEYLADIFRKYTHFEKNLEEKAEDDYLYYRALSIISRKVTKELARLNTCFTNDFDAPHTAITKVIAVYERYREGSILKMQEIRRRYPIRFMELDATLAQRSIYKHESRMLHNLLEREMVTPKVSISLADRFGFENSNGLE